jgi:hypothetical protein
MGRQEEEGKDGLISSGQWLAIQPCSSSSRSILFSMLSVSRFALSSQADNCPLLSQAYASLGDICLVQECSEALRIIGHFLTWRSLPVFQSE